MKLLENKVAIVTGAASGIGEAVAHIFAEAGARVVVSDIDQENGERVTAELKSHGAEAIFVQADTSNPKTMKN